MSKTGRSKWRGWLLICGVALLAQANRAHAQSGLIEHDMLYGVAGGRGLVMDVFHPLDDPTDEIGYDDSGNPIIITPAPPLHPAIILIHGGSWDHGDKSLMNSYGVSLSARGYVCFSLNYRLATATTNRYPAALDDVQLAVRWIRARATRFGIDPKRIGAFGISSGAHLAAMLGVRDTRQRGALYRGYSSRVSCVVDLWGPTDLPAQYYGAPDRAAGMAMVSKFMGGTPAQLPDLYVDASPLAFVNERSAPFFIVQGDQDNLVATSQAQNLYLTLRLMNVEARMLRFPNEGHAILQPANRAVFANQALEFLNAHLMPQMTTLKH